jgi:acetyl esterase/lipase
MLIPFLRRRHDVERIANIRYGAAGKMNMLDVYRHRSRPAASPVLVHFHGGRFVSGAKNSESLPLLYRMASRGWLCLSANYRLSPGASFPDYLIDVKKVLAWVRTHGAEHGADPAVVFVAGNSAGAWLAACAALTPNYAEYQPGFEQADTSVTGAICLYGYYGRIDSTNPESSPLAHLNADAPPFLVIHGDQAPSRRSTVRDSSPDSCARCQASRSFLLSSRELSTPSTTSTPSGATWRST